MRLRFGAVTRGTPVPADASSTAFVADSTESDTPVSIRWLRILVFVAGVCSLSLEMCAPRLLGPYFGTSLFVWANTIGFFLLFLGGGEPVDERHLVFHVAERAQHCGAIIGRGLVEHAAGSLELAR